MYHWGDKTMSFADAILVLNHRVTAKDVAEDVYVAIRSLLNGLPQEIEDATKSGYTNGYTDALQGKGNRYEGKV